MSQIMPQIMPQIIPMKELRDTNKISDLCHEKREPVFITKNGYGDLVIMSMETYGDIISGKRADEQIMGIKKNLHETGEMISEYEKTNVEPKEPFTEPEKPSIVTPVRKYATS